MMLSTENRSIDDRDLDYGMDFRIFAVSAPKQ
jgi:hypothetical protein